MSGVGFGDVRRQEELRNLLDAAGETMGEVSEKARGRERLLKSFELKIEIYQDHFGLYSHVRSIMQKGHGQI